MRRKEKEFFRLCFAALAGGGVLDAPGTAPVKPPAPAHAQPVDSRTRGRSLQETAIESKKPPLSPFPQAFHAQRNRRRRKPQKNEKNLLHSLENSGIMFQGSAISGRTWRFAPRHAPVQSVHTTQHSRTKRLRRIPIIPAHLPFFKSCVCFWRICLCVITLISGGVECFLQGTLDAAACVSGQGPRAGDMLRPRAAGRKVIQKRRNTK